MAQQRRQVITFRRRADRVFEPVAHLLKGKLSLTCLAVVHHAGKVVFSPLPKSCSNAAACAGDIVPLTIKYPRIDVTVRTSGFFRDAFPQPHGNDRRRGARDEPPAINPLAHNVAVDRAELIKAGLSAEEAEQRAAFRVDSDKPGGYGAGVADLLDSGQWQEVADLGESYLSWGGYAYGEGVYGEARQDDFRRRMGQFEEGRFLFRTRVLNPKWI